MAAPITLQPGNVRVASLRLLVPWRGVWLAVLQLDADLAGMVPSAGKVTITLGTTPPVTLAGTIDARGSGQFLELLHMRVVGGGAGWDQPVGRQHFHADNGVLSTQVISATAAEAGEIATVLAPRNLGIDWYRIAGRASRVLDREPSWWVDLTGTTMVGPRPPTVLDPTFTLIEWDPTEERAELAGEGILLPGTTIVDPRIATGPVIVRDVEQRFDGQGCKATAWCADEANTQLFGDLRTMVQELAGVQFLGAYLYRVVLQNSVDGRLQLQAVHRDLGIPDTLPISAWPGLSGASAKLQLGTYVVLRFLEGDPGQPYVDSYQPSVLPLESTVDALAVVHVGPSAVSIKVGGPAAAPLVPAAWATGLGAALAAFAAGLNPTSLAEQASALATALGALPPSATTKAKGV